MKHAISCDDVFEILTRAPFPSGSESDEDVELHLETCPECGRLAEALRPALELFHEAVPPEEINTLPGYFGDLGSSDSRWGARRGSENRRTSRAERRVSWAPMSTASAWRFLAGASLGAVAGFLVWAVGLTNPTTTVFSREHSQMASASPVDADAPGKLVAVMSRLHAPVTCLTVGTGNSGATAQRCCTICHSAGNPNRPLVQFARLAVACQICHLDEAVSNALLTRTSS